MDFSIRKNAENIYDDIDVEWDLEEQEEGELSEHQI